MEPPRNPGRFNGPQTWRIPNYADMAASTLPQQLHDADYWRGWATLAGGLQVPVELSISAERHAAYIWRCQFEDYRVIAASPIRTTADNRSSAQFLAFLKDWTNVTLSPGKCFRSASACRDLADTVWRASLRVASAWRQHMEASLARQKKPPVDGAWLMRIGRWQLLVESPIGVAKLHAPDGEDDLLLFIS